MDKTENAKQYVALKMVNIIEPIEILRKVRKKMLKPYILFTNVIIQLISHASFVEVVNPPKSVAEFGFGLSGNGFPGESVFQQTLRNLVELIIAVYDFLVELHVVGFRIWR